MFPEQSPTIGVGGHLSGRLGDLIYSHGPNGPYSYTYVPHANPNTPNQQRVRGWFRDVSRLWVLFPAKFRTDWATYAANVQRRTAVARPLNLTGFHYFLGALTIRGYTNIGGTVFPPTIFTLGKLTPPVYTEINNSFARTDFFLDDPWRTTVGAGIAFYLSQPQPITVNYFTGPFVFVKRSLGNPAVPPLATSLLLPTPASPALPKVFFRARVIEGDNRLSPSNVQVLDFT